MLIINKEKLLRQGVNLDVLKEITSENLPGLRRSKLSGVGYTFIDSLLNVAKEFGLQIYLIPETGCVRLGYGGEWFTDAINVNYTMPLAAMAMALELVQQINSSNTPEANPTED